MPLSAEASVEGHICRRCVEDRLSTDIRLNQEKPREVLRAERREAFPKESDFVNLRKTTLWVGGISCHRCESECYERHVKVRSEWLDAERSHLRPLLKTEATKAVL